MKQIIKARIEKSFKIKEYILNNALLIDQLKKCSLDFLKALRDGGKIIFAGNKGSLTDAQQLLA